MTAQPVNPETALPVTAAQRFYDENRGSLEAAIAMHAADLETRAERMSKDEIRAAMDEDASEGVTMGINVPKLSAGKVDYVDAYVQRFLAKSDQQAALNAARAAVRDEEEVEYAMRAFIERRDAVTAKILAATESVTTDRARARMLAATLAMRADDLMGAVEAAEQAEAYLARRALGHEPADIARDLVREAMRSLQDLAHLGTNLRMDSKGLERISQANGQREVLGKVAKLLGPDMMTLLNAWF